ncbi:MAG: hypothetical protein LBS26_06265 [Campylobacteraceae bacterium]|jgi:hypothetical protein|nr:hypothetical protein [Campylobacteraceae bacterium]
MKKRLLNTIFKAEELIKTKTVKNADIRELKRNIGYFQHERFIHLIVTVFVGLCDMMSIIIILLAANYATFILSALLTALFIAYIAHYYTLENGTQKLYLLLEKMIKIVREK